MSQLAGSEPVEIDVDHFKRVNDIHGHVVGDGVLKAIADEVSKVTRAPDVPVRYGGEEILVLANVSDPEGARQMAERLRNSVEQLMFKGAEAEFRVTVSVGVAMHRVGESFVELLRRGDAALYEAKARGRNRVCTASS